LDKEVGFAIKKSGWTSVIVIVLFEEPYEYGGDASLINISIMNKMQIL